MIFLIEYDRQEGKIIGILDYLDADWDIAEAQRIKREIWLNSMKIDREVVLLQASSLQALKATHNRYFADLATLQKG